MSEGPKSEERRRSQVAPVVGPSRLPKTVIEDHGRSRQRTRKGMEQTYGMGNSKLVAAGLLGTAVLRNELSRPCAGHRPPPSGTCPRPEGQRVAQPGPSLHTGGNPRGAKRRSQYAPERDGSRPEGFSGRQIADGGGARRPCREVLHQPPSQRLGVPALPQATRPLRRTPPSQENC